MTVFDELFYSIFIFYKNRYKQKANSIAIVYVSFLQGTLLLLLGVFFAGFFRQMNMVTMSATKAWVLFVLVMVFIYFKNWMQYTGKKRMMINAKMIKKKSKTHNIYILWLLPVAIVGLTYIVYQAA